jgi:hypothetical protein
MISAGFILNITFALAALLSTLLILELLLSQKHKSYISSFAVLLWINIDNFNRNIISDIPKSLFNRYVYCSLIYQFTCVAFLILDTEINIVDTRDSFNSLFFPMLAILFFGPFTIKPLFKISYLFRLILFLMSFIVIINAQTVTRYLFFQLTPHTRPWLDNYLSINTREVGYIDLFAGLISHSVIFIPIFVFLAYFPLFLYSFLRILSHLVEFVSRRIAEYPRGPIAAVGLIITAILGLIKIYTQ